MSNYFKSVCGKGTDTPFMPYYFVPPTHVMRTSHFPSSPLPLPVLRFVPTLESAAAHQLGSRNFQLNTKNISPIQCHPTHIKRFFFSVWFNNLQIDSKSFNSFRFHLKTKFSFQLRSRLSTVNRDYLLANASTPPCHCCRGPCHM